MDDFYFIPDLNLPSSIFIPKSDASNFIQTDSNTILLFAQENFKQVLQIHKAHLHKRS
jgi:hypothetical protein